VQVNSVRDNHYREWRGALPPAQAAGRRRRAAQQQLVPGRSARRVRRDENQLNAGAAGSRFDVNVNYRPRDGKELSSQRLSVVLRVQMSVKA